MAPYESGTSRYQNLLVSHEWDHILIGNKNYQQNTKNGKEWAFERVTAGMSFLIILRFLLLDDIL